MRLRLTAFLLLLIISLIHAQNTLGTEGGNISITNITIIKLTDYWAGIVGWLNGTVTNINYPVSTQDTPQPIIYTNEPNGSYAKYYNDTMIITRLDFKPDITDIYAPVASDFNQTGMFSNFTAFMGMNYTLEIEDPEDTLCDPCVFTTYYIYDIPFTAPYITLNANTRMYILKFVNATVEEPLFVGTIESLLGYNGSFFDFEYMVPAFEDYYFYIYHQEECNITVWIDGVETTTFPKTGVPYDVEVLVTDNTSTPVTNATIRAVERNGRNLLMPLLDIAKEFLAYDQKTTNSNGRAWFAISPTRYNIPDSYGYETYLEVNNDYYCRKNLSIAVYDSLSPTYRTDLINDSYGSQVKAGVQNMNSLASTASKWTYAGKMRLANVDVYTNGTYTTPLPTLKAGAPNMINITAYNHITLNEINASVSILEGDGHIIYVPNQPATEMFNNSGRTFYTNESIIIIPTHYNNDEWLTIFISNGGVPFATMTFSVDSTLEPPTGAEADMDTATYIAISSALQNINSVLVNMGKSLSTV